MTVRVEELARTAVRLADSGLWGDAERLWKEVRRLEPTHPQALFALGAHALRRGDIEDACTLLRAARSAEPQNLVLLLTLSVACREANDGSGEREAIEAALAIDPYFLPALLAKAGTFEREGDALSAAVAYRNALKVAPREAHWPATLRPQLEHARAVVTHHSQKFGAHLQRQLGELQAQLTASLAERWREAASIMAGLSTPFAANSNQLHVPRLPAIPFYERHRFPWLSALEGETDAIRAELEELLRTQRDRFTPYIAYRPGEPVNQWQELNHSDRWSALHLWRSGAPVASNLERCPETAWLLATVEMAHIGGLCPNAMFSALAPRTRIPAHHGESNARLVAHLPLIVPERCQLRVGFETRQWNVGEVLIFDDTIEHEAHNDSDELRVVLIFDVWNPLLTPAERTLVQAMTAAAREFRG
jgi:aspartyl/asparaginyl beta-hydroxylase (cupin superfamily)